MNRQKLIIFSQTNWTDPMKDIPQKINDVLPFRAKFAMADLQKISSEELARLTKLEKKELEHFTNLRRQQEYLTSRLLIKDLVHQWEIDVEAFEIHKDQQGRPYGRDKEDQYFVSIAHTKDKVFCGITTDSAIGVDLEPVNRTVPERLRQRILHPEETSALADIEAIRLWTIKEALIKLKGQGLRLNMNAVCIERAEENAFFVEINNDKRAKICSFQKQNNWLAIAYYL